MHISQGPQGELHLRSTGRKFYRDSTLLYHAAKHLNKMFGLDVIRKDAGKDGQLTSVGNFYIVDRKRRYAWHFDEYQIATMYEQFNMGAPVCVHLQPLGDWPALKLVA